jgi:tetratricopeptide (TPR) repeat protein
LGVDNPNRSQADGSRQDAPVQHLVDLGYVDPLETAARAEARRQELTARLKQATELKRQGRGQEAAALLVELASDDPDWTAPHQLLAEIYYSAGDLSAAESQLEWLAYHGVDQPRIALISAGIALVRRDLRTALTELEFAHRVEPELPSVNALLGTVFLRLGRWDEAEDAFREAARQDPLDARARDGLATVELHYGEFEGAVDWALRALDQDIRLFSAHYHLGLALMGLNRPEDAVAALEAAARVNSQRLAPYYWLSRIARDQLGDSSRAAHYSDKARHIIRQRRDLRQSAVIST